MLVATQNDFGVLQEERESGSTKIKIKRMEKSTTSTGSPIASATEDEIVVSLILLDLKRRISLSESLSGFNWGRRRRRSCLEVPPPSTSASSLPTPSPENIIEEMKLKAQKDEHGAAAAAVRPTTSPDTPLNFSPSASDEKKSSSRKRLRPKDEYLVMIEDITKSNVLLTGKIENLKMLHHKLKAFNYQLQAKKQKVLNLGGPNLGAVSSADRTVQDCQPFFSPILAHQAPLDNGLKWINHGGPLGFDFDLNLAAEVYDERSRSAEARRKRIGIIKARRTRIRTVKTK